MELYVALLFLFTLDLLHSALLFFFPFLFSLQNLFICKMVYVITVSWTFACDFINCFACVFPELGSVEISFDTFWGDTFKYSLEETAVNAFLLTGMSEKTQM